MSAYASTLDGDGRKEEGINIVEAGKGGTNEAGGDMYRSFGGGRASQKGKKQAAESLAGVLKCGGYGGVKTGQRVRLAIVPL